MWPVFEQALTRYRDLERQLSDPALAADRVRFARVAKEHGALGKQVKPYLEFLKVGEDVRQAEALLAAEGDADMRRYAEEELAGLRALQDTLRGKLEDFLL